MKTIKYIGRCGKKGCNCVLRVSIPAVEKKRTVGTVCRRQITELCPTFAPYQLFLSCAAHRRELRWDKVEGVVSEHVCDSRCTSAMGPTCDCSCGGENHGAAHGVKLNLN